MHVEVSSGIAAASTPGEAMVRRITRPVWVSAQ